jgi:hypothetical protein
VSLVDEKPVDSDATIESTATRPSVYLDTSIPSYLTARQAREPLLRRNQWITCLWWNAHRSRFEPL